MNSRVFTFVLFDDASSYDVTSVLESLKNEFTDFAFVHHNKRFDGSPCNPHYHCVGKSAFVKSNLYYHKRYNIPLCDITIPNFPKQVYDILYDQCLDYFESTKVCEG